VRPAAADHFGVDIRSVIRDNLRLFRVNPNMTYKYQSTIQVEEMAQTLQVVKSVTQGMLGTPAAPLAGSGASEPYFVCSYYDADGRASQVKCDGATLQANLAACTRPGTVGGCHVSYDQ
jgi:hypothetical protein